MADSEDECVMLIAVNANEDTFLPEITLTLPPSDTSEYWTTLPMTGSEAAHLGGYLLQASVAVSRLTQELQDRDLTEREEIMSLYAQYQEPDAGSVTGD